MSYLPESVIATAAVQRTAADLLHRAARGWSSSWACSAVTTPVTGTAPAGDRAIAAATGAFVACDFRYRVLTKLCP